jgi:hypothetical protein
MIILVALHFCTLCGGDQRLAADKWSRCKVNVLRKWLGSGLECPDGRGNARKHVASLLHSTAVAKEHNQ